MHSSDLQANYKCTTQKLNFNSIRYDVLPAES